LNRELCVSKWIDVDFAELSLKRFYSHGILASGLEVGMEYSKDLAIVLVRCLLSAF
jgi:hypothetical protein